MLRYGAPIHRCQRQVQSGSGADYSRDLIGGTSEPGPAPNQSWSRVFRSAWRKGCTATLTFSNKFSSRLQLSYFKQGVRILVICHF
jgi:hypothetical protein